MVRCLPGIVCRRTTLAVSGQNAHRPALAGVYTRRRRVVSARQRVGPGDNNTEPEEFPSSMALSADGSVLALGGWYEGSAALHGCSNSPAGSVTLPQLLFSRRQVIDANYGHLSWFGRSVSSADGMVLAEVPGVQAAPATLQAAVPRCAVIVMAVVRE
jgi:hypothetical protein